MALVLPAFLLGLQLPEHHEIHEHLLFQHLLCAPGGPVLPAGPIDPRSPREPFSSSLSPPRSPKMLTIIIDLMLALRRLKEY